MYMTTCHKSGDNETNKFRFSAIGRYHATTSDDFAPFRYNYNFNRYAIEKIKQKEDIISKISPLQTKKIISKMDTISDNMKSNP